MQEKKSLKKQIKEWFFCVLADINVKREGWIGCGGEGGGWLLVSFAHFCIIFSQNYFLPTACQNVCQNVNQRSHANAMFSCTVVFIYFFYAGLFWYAIFSICVSYKKKQNYRSYFFIYIHFNFFLYIQFLLLNPSFL